MKPISAKKIYAAWAALAAAMAFLFLGVLRSRWWFAGFAAFLAVYVFITFRYLRCPRCGRIDSLDQRTAAIHSRRCCRFCGEMIVISK